ncbi:MAG: prolipoprotein diacylglyceryl transferase [Vulcanimicrobiaceae bacterium]
MDHWFRYPNIDPIAFHLGPVAVHWYGISYLAGFVAAYLWMSRPESKRRLGLSNDQIQDFLMYALIGVLVGGRTFFVINDIISKHNASDYFSHPLNFIAVWNGGMAFHGGVVGVIVAIFLFIRKHPGLTYRVLGDETVMMLPVGIALTRIVNFINDEFPGRICNPDRPYCLAFPNYPDGYRYPSQIFECILDILTLPVLLVLYRMKLPDGVVGWAWFTIYGLTRSVAEIWRQPDFSFYGVTGGQLYALPMIVIGGFMTAISYQRGVRTETRTPAPKN